MDVSGPLPGAPESAARGTLMSLLAQLTTAAFTAALTLFLVRSLGAEGFGVLMIAVALASLLALPGDVGISNGTARFVAEARGDRRLAAQIVGAGLRLKLLVSVPLGAGLVAAAGPVAQAYGMPALEWPLRIVAVVLVAQGVMLYLVASFAALTRLRWQLRVFFAESVLETGASVVLVMSAGGATAAACGRAIGYVAAAGFALVLALRALGRGVLPRVRGTPGLTRRIARYGGALAIVDGAFALFSQVHILLLGALAGAAASGAFGAAMRLCVLLHYPGLAVANAVAPRVAAGDPGGAARLQRALRLLLAVGIVEAVVVLVFAGPISTLLLGDGYAASADTLRALAPYVLLSAVAPLASLAVNYAGGAARRIPIALGTVVLSVALGLLLIPSLGVVGAAIAIDVAYLLYVPAHVWLCARLVGVDLRAIVAPPALGWASARNRLSSVGSP